MSKGKENKLLKRLQRIETGKEMDFNPADYDYMDSMASEVIGWLWEFERRSKAYKEAYSEYVLKGNFGYLENNPSANRLLFLEDCQYDPSKKWSEVEQVRSVSPSKTNPLKVINLKWRVDFSSPVKKLKKKPSDYLKEEYEKHNIKINFKNDDLPESSEINSVFTDDGKQYPLEEYPKIQRQLINGKVILTCDFKHPFSTFFWQLGKENVVMALIDISATQTKINESLEIELDKWRKALNIKPQKAPRREFDEYEVLIKKANKWKSYLIVYDLIGEKKQISYKKITFKLQEFGKNYSNEKNIENYYKKAKKLINGDYKKLL